MRLRTFAPVVIAVVCAQLDATPPSCFGGGNEYESLDELKMRWSPGDRIICLMPHIPEALRIHHHMMVVDDENVIHLVKKHDGYYVDIDSYADCAEVMRECRNKGHGKYGKEAVQRARKWKSDLEPVYYNMLTCNCRHYVNYWVDGEETKSCPSFKELDVRV